MIKIANRQILIFFFDFFLKKHGSVNIVIPRPNIVNKYNSCMGGIDLID